MLMWLCIFAFLLFGFIWMAEALQRQWRRDRKKCRQLLKSRLYSVKWEEEIDEP